MVSTPAFQSHEVVVAVRRALVRRWIDINQLDIHYYRGLLRLRGPLQRLSGALQQIDAAFLKLIEQDLHKVAGVKHLDLDFDNWSRADGTWSAR